MFAQQANRPHGRDGADDEREFQIFVLYLNLFSCN